MTVVARLSAYLFADTASFETGMKRAEKSLLSLGNVAKTALEADAIVRAFDAAIDVVKQLTVEQFRAIDAQAKMANSLGVSLREFNAMSRVADEAGVNQDSFAKSLTNTEKALFSAATGSTEAQNEFKALGLNFRDLARLSPDEQFRQVADALSKVQNPAEKVALATKLYGKEGRDVINMLGDYKKNLDDARAFNDKFNLSLSEIDARKVEEANGTMKRVEDAAKGLANTIAVKVSPLISEMGQEFLDSGIDAKTFGKAVDSGLQIAATAIDYVKTAVLGMKGIFAEVSLDIDLMVLSATSGLYKLAKSAESLPGVGQKMKAVEESMSSLNEAAQDTAKQDLKTIDDINKQAADYESTASKIAKIQEDADKRAKASAKTHKKAPPAMVSEGISDMDGALSRQKALLKSIVGPALDLQQTMSDLNLLYKTGRITADQYNDALDKIKLQVAELDKTETGGFVAGLMKIKMSMTDIGSIAEESIVSSFNQVNGTAQHLQVTLAGLNILMAQNPQYARQYADAILAAKIQMAEFDKTAQGGFTAGMLVIQQEMNNVGDLAEQAVVDGLHKAEDALVDFAMTGKASFKDMANSIISDLIRIQIRQAESGFMDKFSAAGGLSGILSGLFGGGSSSTGGGSLPDLGIKNALPSFAVGTDYVPHDMVAKIHKGEKITPAAENTGRKSDAGDQYYIDARGADQAAIARLEGSIKALNGSIERRALGAVQDKFRRSSSFGKYES